MTITVGGTSITFNDATTQTTAAVSATTANVLAATAAATAGAVGTYAFAGVSTAGTALAFGNTRAGSSLIPAGIGSTNSGCFVYAIVSASGSALSGTWRLMGYVSSVTYGHGSLWLRIS